MNLKRGYNISKKEKAFYQSLVKLCEKKGLKYKFCNNYLIIIGRFKNPVTPKAQSPRQ